MRLLNTLYLTKYIVLGYLLISTLEGYLTEM